MGIEKKEGMAGYSTLAELIFLTRREEKYAEAMKIAALARRADDQDGVRTLFRNFLTNCEARRYGSHVDRKQIRGEIKAIRGRHGLD